MLKRFTSLRFVMLHHQYSFRVKLLLNWRVVFIED
jgi:hypothetical protein